MWGYHVEMLEFNVLMEILEDSGENEADIIEFGHCGAPFLS